MALLKHISITCISTILAMYPSLKSDGSIEAGSPAFIASLSTIVSIAEKRWLYWSYGESFESFMDALTYPSLKSDGSIEALVESKIAHTDGMYPSLKSDGSIEARYLPN